MLRKLLWSVVSMSLLGNWNLAARAEDAKPAALPSTRTLARNFPVITVENVCPKAAPRAGGCKTVITREEFEDLVEAVNPRMTKSDRQQLAQNYGRMLALEGEALRRGIDKKPQMQALLRYVRASALGGGAFRRVVREASENSEAAEEKYYKEHQASFERYTLERLFIPAIKQQVQQAKPLERDDGDEAALAEMKTLAEKMRAQAAAGEDFAALEKEIAQQSGLPTAPAVEINDVLPGTLAKEHNQVFDLPAGSVSAMIADGNGFYVYKVMGKKAPEFESIRQQVKVELENHRAAAELKKIEHVTVNDTYFEKYDPPVPNPNEPEVEDD